MFFRSFRWRASFNTQPRGGGCRAKWLKLHVKMFQHTAARRRLQYDHRRHDLYPLFQHTAARRRLHTPCHNWIAIMMFQHTAARRRLPNFTSVKAVKILVSTHSRAEAAATFVFSYDHIHNSFNTQPRGGGCKARKTKANCGQRFNTQPRGGGCVRPVTARESKVVFQHTAARRRLLLSTS